MKRFLPTLVTLLIGIVVLGAVAYFFLSKGKTSGGGNTGDQPVTETPAIIEENPYVTLTPRTDGHEFKMVIANLTNAETIDYEFTYMAGDFSRGAIGQAKLNGEKSVTKNLLLGSESCSGTGNTRVCKYRYDEGVTEGNLLLKFRKSGKIQKLDMDFHLQQGDKTVNKLFSKDGNFTFEGKTQSKTFYAIHSTVGALKAPAGKIIAGPMGIFTTGSKTLVGKVVFLLKEDGASAKILGWDEQSSTWKEYATKAEGQEVSASVDRLTTFVITN